MPLTTPGVVLNVSPTVIGTYISHYLNRRDLHQKPTAHVSYHEGLTLIRKFLVYASHHTVEEVQSFTGQWVPSPRWIRTENIVINKTFLNEAAKALIAQLGHRGIDQVGGENWWQWRRDDTELEAEWIEMRRDYNRWKHSGGHSNRIMLYIHGGAYFFGSVDEHRYQMQRHARKLGARVIAPRYRLAPQYPFPCGLLDCLATYLYLLSIHSPSEILIAGDSAGGGMAVSLLILLRDRGISFPAGGILISPWVDLTHSFPSLAGDEPRDYIPSHGFWQRPSPAWPPPNEDEMHQIAVSAVKEHLEDKLPKKASRAARKEAGKAATHDIDVAFAINSANANARSGAKTNGTTRKILGEVHNIPGPGHGLSVEIDGQLVSIKDQIQMYTTNHLISHPMVSTVLQPSLGGLPPLLITTGGGEILRDEQIYLAHKAANPAKYPPGKALFENHAPLHEGEINKWPPTDVQLQVWDDLCHVAPTLSFSRPAKYMFRSIAQFGAWALARAQHTGIDIQDDDAVSVISNKSDDSSDQISEATSTRQTDTAKPASSKHAKTQKSIGRAGDPLPIFEDHMIRQRVDRHGDIFPLDDAELLPALQVDKDSIGVIKSGPVKKWLKAKEEWGAQYAREREKLHRQRVREIAKGYSTFGHHECPPPSALAGRRGPLMPKDRKKPRRSWGLSLWSLWGSSHDENTVEREEMADKEASGTSGEGNAGDGKTSTIASQVDGAAPDPGNSRPALSSAKSYRRTVSYLGQDRPSGANSVQASTVTSPALQAFTTDGLASPHSNGKLSLDSDHLAVPGTLSSERPAASGGKVFPFKLGTRLSADGTNASTVTLKSQGEGVIKEFAEDTQNK